MKKVRQKMLYNFVVEIYLAAYAVQRGDIDRGVV